MRPTRATIRTVTTVLAAVFVLAAWLLASPPGSSPDDGYHLSSIWCARGFDADLCIDATPPGSTRTELALVPETLNAVTCMAFQTTRAADCVLDALALPPDRLTVTDGGNIRQERASLYYRTMHVFVSDDFPRSFMLIRITNAAVALLALVLTLLVAPRNVRAAVAVTWLITSIPLGLFLLTSLNSSAWGFVGLGLVWANALTLIHAADRRTRAAAATLLVVGAVMALGARTEALGHLAFSTVALLFIALERPGSSAHRAGGPTVTSRMRGLVVVATAAASVVMALLLSRLAPLDYIRTTLSAPIAGYDRLVLGGRGQPLIALFTEVPLLWTGAFGDRFGLGWLDTAMPIIVYVFVLAAFMTLLGLGLQGARRGRIAAVATMTVALFALPVYTLLSIGAPVGESYQPRHYLPTTMLLLGIALVGSHGRPQPHLGRGGVAGLAAIITIAHAVALHTNIRRYTTGLRLDVYLDLNREVDWWWAHGPSPMTTWIIGSLAFGVLAVLVLDLMRRPADAVSSESQQSLSR